MNIIDILLSELDFTANNFIDIRISRPYTALWKYHYVLYK